MPGTFDFTLNPLTYTPTDLTVVWACVDTVTGDSCTVSLEHDGVIVTVTITETANTYSLQY